MKTLLKSASIFSANIDKFRSICNAKIRLYGYLYKLWYACPPGRKRKGRLRNFWMQTVTTGMRSTGKIPKDKKFH